MKRLTVPILLCMVAACSDSNNSGPDPVDPAPPPPPPPPANAVFEISAVNLTIGQPLSPLAVIAHDDSYRAFTVGEAATPGLELLAEGGDNSEFLDEVEGRGEASGESPVGPGASDTVTLELDSDDTAGTLLTVMTMLVNTNDAFSGLNGINISGMAVDDSFTRNTIAYDAGTEANSEAPGTIPGPADGGEGLNSNRDDLADQVTMHGGVVSSDDGLSGSVLNQTHRFDNPVIRITVTRTQ